MLISVEKRMKDDWDVLTRCLKEHRDLIPFSKHSELYGHWGNAEFSWAWLNVNTRCLYHKLGFADSEDNITMCPLLDFANHTPLQSLSITQDEFALRDGMAFSSSVSLRVGDEVYLRYGGHSNAVLFTEYGFVLSCTEEAHALDGEILVDHHVEEMLRSQKDCAEKIQLLKDRNYWHDWSLYVEDGVGRPSYRLLPALRLFHIPLGRQASDELDIWVNMLLGLTEVVSVENERKVRASLGELCDRIICNGSLPISDLRLRVAQLESGRIDRNEGYLQVLRMAIELWEEEHRISKLVKKAIADGVEF